MPALPAVAGVFRASLKYAVGSDTNVGTHSFWTYTGPVMDDDDALSWAQVIHGHAVTEFGDLLSTASALESVEVQDLSSSTGGVGEYADTVAGTAGAAALPAGVAALINFPIQRHYRGGKPKAYLPIGDVANLASATLWTTTFKNDVTAAWNSFIADLLAISGEPQSCTGQTNVSYYSGYLAPRTRSNGHLYYPPAPRATPHLDPIGAGVCNAKPGSQRRRYQR